MGRSRKRQAIGGGGKQEVPTEGAPTVVTDLGRHVFTHLAHDAQVHHIWTAQIQLGRGPRPRRTLASLVAEMEKQSNFPSSSSPPEMVRTVTLLGGWLCEQEEKISVTFGSEDITTGRDEHVWHVRVNYRGAPVCTLDFGSESRKEEEDEVITVTERLPDPRAFVRVKRTKDGALLGLEFHANQTELKQLCGQVELVARSNT